MLRRRRSYRIVEEEVQAGEDRLLRSNSFNKMEEGALQASSSRELVLFHESPLERNQRNPFLKIPLDVFFEIASYLNQRALVVLSETCHLLRTILISPDSNGFWITRLSSVQQKDLVLVPEWNAGRHERFSALILSSPQCQLCQKPIQSPVVLYPLRLAICYDCEKSNLGDRDSFRKNHKIHPRAFDLVPTFPDCFSLVDIFLDEERELYFRPTLERISVKLFELEKLHKQQQLNLGSDFENVKVMTDLEKYEEGLRQRFAVNSLISEKFKSLESARYNERRQRFNDAKSIRRTEIERLLAPYGWGTQDFTPEWRKMLRAKDPINEDLLNDPLRGVTENISDFDSWLQRAQRDRQIQATGTLWVKRLTYVASSFYSLVIVRSTHYRIPFLIAVLCWIALTLVHLVFRVPLANEQALNMFSALMCISWCFFMWYAVLVQPWQQVSTENPWDYIRGRVMFEVLFFDIVARHFRRLLPFEISFWLWLKLGLLGYWGAVVFVLNSQWLTNVSGALLCLWFYAWMRGFSLWRWALRRCARFL